MRREKNFLNPARIRVVGIGGGGARTIDRLVSANIVGVDYVAINTDREELNQSKATIRIPIGEHTYGRSTGGNPILGEQAAQRAAPELRELFQSTDLLFMTACMGGGTGTGAAPLIAKMAQDLDILTVAVVTSPFSFEGNRQAQIAKSGIDRLKHLVDTLIVIPNDRLIELSDRQTKLDTAVRLADQVLLRSVQVVSELIVQPGLINLDFADLRNTIRQPGATLMGRGEAAGEGRAVEAARQAAVCPILNITIAGAKHLLVNIKAGPDWNLWEMEQATAELRKLIALDANIIFGTDIDRAMGNRVCISLVATGFDGIPPGHAPPLPQPQDRKERGEDVSTPSPRSSARLTPFRLPNYLTS